MKIKNKKLHLFMKTKIVLIFCINTLFCNSSFDSEQAIIAEMNENQNESILPETSSSCYGISRIPIHSFPFLTKHKFMQIQIDQKTYLALIDTGAVHSFMRKDVLDEITNKAHISDSDYYNIYGKNYFTSNFLIPEVKIGNICTELILQEEAENFFTDCIIYTNPFISWKVYLMYEIFRDAIIGMDVFKKYACIFDFPHSSIFLAEQMADIIDNEDFSTTEFHSMRFESGKIGSFTFETDLGKKKLLLDAGSSSSLIQLTDEEKIAYDQPSKFKSQTLAINGLDFGNWTFRVMDFTKELNDIDGILGVDFFNKNIICFDFPNQKVYIQTPRLGSKERFNYWLKSYFGL